MTDIHPDYGAYRSVVVRDPDYLFSILDELAEELKYNIQEDYNASFHYHQRCEIADAFKNEKLFGLQIEETACMIQRGAAEDLIFLRYASSWPFHVSWEPTKDYRLPFFCIVDDDFKITMAWCAQRVIPYNLLEKFKASLSE